MCHGQIDKVTDQSNLNGWLHFRLVVQVDQDQVNQIFLARKRFLPLKFEIVRRLLFLEKKRLSQRVATLPISFKSDFLKEQEAAV